VDLADASPNLGWRGRERKGLSERGKPALVFCLALLHHLVLGANLPLREILEWLAELTSDLVIEFVTRADPRVQQLLRHKQDQYSDYDQAYFERCLAQGFELVHRETLGSGTRILYHARSRSRGCS
jgi:hypothetical protein